ncbi:MAG: hypothetical protein E4G94_02295 [ANME-2 cluster archaeon]|nr:MAG: hypothetical protein E4G94_02295 [ANME-2 cluster archaeon]
MNSHYFEEAPSLSHDGIYIYFSRFINGVSDNYRESSKIIEILRPL